MPRLDGSSHATKAFEPAAATAAAAGALQTGKALATLLESAAHLLADNEWHQVLLRPSARRGAALSGRGLPSPPPCRQRPQYADLLAQKGWCFSSRRSTDWSPQAPQAMLQ
eukprot:4512959-Prymnesium_polylepis.1